jgi:hypothetical protein
VLQSRNHDRPWSFVGFGLFLDPFEWIGILDHEREPHAVRRPLECLHALLHIRQSKRFAAAGWQRPDLVLPAAIRNEADVPAIR